jgi:hypothetical protein
MVVFGLESGTNTRGRRRPTSGPHLSAKQGEKARLGGLGCWAAAALGGPRGRRGAGAEKENSGPPCGPGGELSGPAAAR